MKIQDFTLKKHQGVPISMVTCYDAWSASLIAETEIDCILVGDSLAMVVYGHETTLPVDIDTMAAHTAAVRRGAPDTFLIGDMPFLSYRRGLEVAMDNVAKLMRAGAQAVKLEGAAGNIELIRHLVESGVPVMGHLGLTPQSVHQLGGFKVQARNDEAAAALVEQAAELERVGLFRPRFGGGAGKRRRQGHLDSRDPHHRYRRGSPCGWPGARPPGSTRGHHGLPAQIRPHLARWVDLDSRCTAGLSP